MPVKILLGDDHIMVRDGLKFLLKQIPDLEVVGEADNGRDIVRLSQKFSPDIVIMDIAMPELNGIEATRQILNENPEVKVIALSMHSSRRMVEEMIQAGAVGYVLKNSAFEELAEAVRNVRSNRAYISPSITAIVLEKIARPGSGEPTPSSVLSPREREVLQMLSEGKSTKEISAAINVSPSTVETHRRKIMQKLNIKTLPELTKFAIREGITSVDS